jgi:hypothetical protein
MWLLRCAFAVSAVVEKSARYPRKADQTQQWPVDAPAPGTFGVPLHRTCSMQSYDETSLIPALSTLVCEFSYSPGACIASVEHALGNVSYDKSPWHNFHIVFLDQARSTIFTLSVVSKPYIGDKLSRISPRYLFLWIPFHLLGLVTRSFLRVLNCPDALIRLSKTTGMSTISLLKPLKKRNAFTASSDRSTQRSSITQAQNPSSPLTTMRAPYEKPWPRRSSDLGQRLSDSKPS